MFEKPRALRLAAYSGMLAAITYLVLGVAATGTVLRLDPFSRVDWDLQMQSSAARFPEHFFAGGVLVIVHLLTAFFFLALAHRAALVHPTTARIGGGLLLGAVAISGFHRIWQVFGTDLIAVRYASVESAEVKAALQHAYQLSAVMDSVMIATAVTLSLPGFVLIAYALKDRPGLGRVVAPAFLLSAFTQFLAVLSIGYAFDRGRLDHTFSRLIAGLSALGVWALPVLAVAVASFWLLREATPPEEEAIEEARPRMAA